MEIILEYLKSVLFGIVQGITEACKELNAPVILQVSAGARKYANHTYLTKLVEAAEIETGLPIALHLDHGSSFELCKDCIDGGFTLTTPIPGT